MQQQQIQPRSGPVAFVLNVEYLLHWARSETTSPKCTGALSHTSRRVAEPPAEFSNWRLGEAGGSAPCICQCMCQSSRSPAFNYRSSPSPSLQDNKPASWQAATARPAFLPPERAGRETGDFWFDSDRCCLRCFEHAAWTLSCQS